MNRRDSLKVLGLTAISSAVLLDACKPGEPKATATAEAGDHPGREEWEVLRDKTLMEEKFFSPHEMATIAVLSDIIIPKDDISGSATEAKVPEFIEFIVKDMPEHKTPMRGGLRWLDLQCLNRWEKPFKDVSAEQKIEMVDQIAYPKKAKPGMEQGVAFFNLMRNLTASGFYTTEMGVKDIGYVGNVPNKWEGVPADVLKQYGFDSAS
ncbi:gluconate 2-dehydrogenase subunit 3 family protein [Pedobacter gandavensis]|uniref:gluconate 2-dehydrogenase subunit 3 family protein n=1 Tax=Pedobacter gandavensis TaxID=2679963 RepID=UPI0029300B5F|nr:gluconate 2-dehydrogenase subunit 3 family protein [Pedobacter gandavensis]